MTENQVRGEPPRRPEGDCPTTTVTVTQTQYAATVTSTIGANSINGTSTSSTPPTTITTITLIPSGIVITHNTTTCLNCDLITSPTPPASLSHETSSTTTTPASTPDSHTDPSHQAGRVAGGVLGSLAGLALLIFLLAWCCKRKTEIKLRLRCRRQTKEEKEVARKEEQWLRAEEERAVALQALESSAGSEPGGGLLHSRLTFGFVEGGSGKQLPAPPPPLAVPRKPVPSAASSAGVGEGRYYA